MHPKNHPHTPISHNENGGLGGLLEYIAHQCHCAFLSDIHYFPQSVKEVLPPIPAEQYSLQEWEDAVEYIAGVSLHFQSAAEAKTYLMERLFSK